MITLEVIDEAIVQNFLFISKSERFSVFQKLNGIKNFFTIYKLPRQDKFALGLQRLEQQL